jgi:hypothetical protein
MYNSTIKIIRDYISAYGGIKSLLKSFYFLISLLIALVLYNSWSEPLWWETIFSIMPNLIGFTLGGYAIFLAFGDSDFQSLISGKGDLNNSPLMGVSSTFVHFIVIQIISLIFALIAKSFYHPAPDIVITIFSWSKINFYTVNDYIRNVFWFICYFLFIYAIILTFASTLAIFRISRWLDAYHSKKNQMNKRKHRKLPNKRINRTPFSKRYWSRF